MTLRELVIENPLLIEFKRAVRRFFGVSKHSAVNAMVLVISCLLYGLLLLITISNRQAMSPVAIIYVQTFLFCFIIPANLHGAIAGERERRSWDLLLAAPIENIQIVVGKLVSGLAAVGTTCLLMLPPMLISWMGDVEATFAKVAQAELVSIGFAIALSAITLLISARSKRAYGAQLVAYAFLMVTQIVYLVFIQVLLSPNSYNQADQAMRNNTMFLHPFWAIGIIWWPQQGGSSSGSILYSGWFNFLAYLTIAAAVVWYTVRTLQAADGEDGRSR